MSKILPFTGVRVFKFLGNAIFYKRIGDEYRIHDFYFMTPNETKILPQMLKNFSDLVELSGGNCLSILVKAFDFKKCKTLRETGFIVTPYVQPGSQLFAKMLQPKVAG